MAGGGRRGAGLVLLTGLLAARGAPAQLNPGTMDGTHVALSGYVRVLTALHDASFDQPDVPRITGFHGEVVRLKWRVTSGERFSLSVHDRLDVRVTSATTAFGNVAGFGVSVVPSRPIDLSTLLVDDERVTVRHDVDRFALTVRSPLADVTIGRQAITWGVSSLFPIADLWAQFSPFELDTEEKAGTDAVRVLTYPAPRVELDVVAAARRRARDWTLAGRVSVDLPIADAYAAAGKFWNEGMVLGGLVYVRDQSKLRIEAAFPWDLDAHRWQRVRLTLGADWLSARLALSVEYHHNGIGVDDPAGYAARLTDARVQRGETYYLGRHYVGMAASYTADEQARLSLALTALWNLGDGSASVTPVVSYDFGQSTRLSLGTLQAFGRTPVLAPPALRSEFGTYGDLWFTRLSVYF